MTPLIQCITERLTPLEADLRRLEGTEGVRSFSATLSAALE